MNSLKGKKKCPVCGFVCRKAGIAVYHHFLRMHQVMRYTCDICNRKFCQKSELKKHMKQHETVDTPCLFCKKLCRLSKLRDHISYAHGRDKIHSCLDCNVFFVTKKKLEQHFASHIQHKCLGCKEKFNVKVDAVKHQKRCVHFLHCPICNTSFRKFRGMKTHCWSQHNSSTPEEVYQQAALIPKSESPEVEQIKHEPEDTAMEEGNSAENTTMEEGNGSEDTGIEEGNGAEDTGIEEGNGAEDTVSDERQDAEDVTELNEVMNANPIECPHQPCNYRAANEKKMYRHVFHKHRELKHFCQICNKGYSVRSDLSKHMKNHDAKTPCIICKKGYRPKDILEHVKLAHSDVNTHYCSDCQTFHKTSKLLQLHFAQEHKYTCYGCKEIVLTKEAWRNHRRACEKCLKCPHCRKTFPTPHNVRRHIINAHESPAMCELCGETLRNAYTLENHMKMHERHPEKTNFYKFRPFACDQCDLKCTNTQMLTNHKNRMHREKIYFCEHCNKGFCIKSELDKHSYTHKDIQCPVCESMVKYRSIRSHIKSNHGPECLNYCSDCQLFLPSVLDYENHVQTAHTSLLPHECHGCHERFPYKVDLRAHSVSCILALTCTQCGLVARDKLTLKKHTRVTHQPRDYMCDVCGKYFLYPSELTKHLEKRHDYVVISVQAGDLQPADVTVSTVASLGEESQQVDMAVESIMPSV